MACLLWIFGFELLPNVHVGMHELFGHHHHEGGVAHAARAHEGEHGHGHGHGPRPTDHADDHVHDHDHVHVHVHDHVDEHAHPHPHHAEPEAEPEPEAEIAFAPIVAPADDIAACESSQDHGRHSLAHRGVAVTQPPWVLAPVASAPFRVLPRVDTSTAQPPSRPLPSARARGPPELT